MTSQLVTSRAHQGMPSGIVGGDSLCSSMQGLCRERFFSRASSRRPNCPGGGIISTCRQIQGVRLYDVEVGVTSQLGIRWAFAPFDGVTIRSVRLYRKWNKCSGNGCGVLGRRMRINAVSNLEATGLRQTSNASGNQESDTVILDVQGMKSGSCVPRVRKLLAADMRVLSVAVSLATQTAAIRLKPCSKTGAEDNLKVGSELASFLTGSGFAPKLRPTGKAESTYHRQREEIAKKREELLKNSLGQVAFAWALGALCFAAHATHLLHSVGIQGFMGGIISSFVESPIYRACISSVALVGPGRDLLVDGVKAFWRGSPNLNSLVGVGAGAFCSISAVSLVFPLLNWDAALLDVPVMLLALVLLGRAMDGQARAEASRGMDDLLSGLPSRSRLVVSDSSRGEPIEGEAGLTQGLVVGVDPEQLRPGDYVLVLPGEVIPVDGKVIKGNSVVDESMLVGKPLSVHKTSGNIVSAGTVNREGPLTVEATATGAQSAVSNIIKHVEEVPKRNATVELLADVLPSSSAFFIMSLSAATFFFWYIIGAYVWPDVLYKDAASDGSAFFPSLKLATDVLVVGCFCTLGLATLTGLLFGRYVGAKKRRLTRRDDCQKRSGGMDSVLPYKDGDIVAGTNDAGPPSEDPATAESGASCEEIGAMEKDARSIIDDPEGEEPRASCKDTIADDLTSLTNDPRDGQPVASCEDFIAVKDDRGPSLDYTRAEQPASSREDVIGGKDDAESLTDNSEAEQFGASGEVIVAGKVGAGSVGTSKAEQHDASGEDVITIKDKARPPPYDDKEELGASDVYLVAEKEDAGPPRDDLKAEQSGDGGEGLVADEDHARSLSVEFTGEELSASGQEFVAKDDRADLPSVESEAQQQSAGEMESISERDERGLPTVSFESEEHGASEQGVFPKGDDAGSPTVESEVEERSSVELDLAAKKDNAGSSSVEPKAEEQHAAEQEFKVGKDVEGSASVDSNVEESSSSGQNLIADEDDWGSRTVDYRVLEHSSSDQVVVAEKFDAGPRTVEAELGEHTVGQQELLLNKCDEESPTGETKAEEFKQGKKGAEDKAHGGEEGETPAKKVRKRREYTVTKSGWKRVGKDECDPGTKKTKKKKDPTAPKRALSAFMCFSQAVREDLKRSQPELSFLDTGRVLGEMWQKMSADEKAPFEAVAEADKERYRREMQKWCEGGKDDIAKG